jgi:uncharacterized protein (DUF58 family)
VTVFSALTIRGRCLVAAGVAAAGCSLALDERDLLRVAAFVTTLPLLALLVSGRGRRGVAARREIFPGRVAVGSEATVRLHITGRGRIALGSLLLEDGVPHALGGRPRFLVHAAGRRSGSIVEYTVQPRLRGIHQIGPLRTRVSDPFGLSEFERELADRNRLVAVPKVVPLGGLPAGAGRGAGEDGSTRLRAGYGEDDSTVRQYRHGDDMRRVHWKTTARRDELMVRVEERPWHGGLTVLLDRRSAAHRGSGAASSLEWAVSAAASICTHLHRQGEQVRLVTEDEQILASGTGFSETDHNERVLEALAALRPSAQRDLVWGSDPGGGRELIAVLGATTASGVAELTRLRPHGTRSLAVLLDVRAWSGDTGDGGFDPRDTARRLRASGWTTVIVEGPHVSMPEVWAELCREGTAQQGSGVA